MERLPLSLVAALILAGLACQQTDPQGDDADGAGGEAGQTPRSDQPTQGGNTSGQGGRGGTAGVAVGQGGRNTGGGGSAGASTPSSGGQVGHNDDAGAPDASPDAVASGNGSRCESSGLPVCLNFESASLPTTWTSVSTRNPKVEKGRAFRGDYALHFANLKTEAPLIRSTKLTGITSVLWGRMFVFVTPAMPDGHGALVAGFDQADNWYEVGFQFRNYHGNWHPPAGVPERWMNSQVRVPADKWVCVEWSFDGAKPDVTHIWSDGKEVVYSEAAAFPGPAKVQSFKKLEIGFTPYWGSDATDMWVDELAVSATRIGCEK